MMSTHRRVIARRAGIGFAAWWFLVPRGLAAFDWRVQLIESLVAGLIATVVPWRRLYMRSRIAVLKLRSALGLGSGKSPKPS